MISDSFPFKFFLLSLHVLTFSLHSLDTCLLYIYNTPNKLPLETQGGYLGGYRGSTIQNIGKLSDWHQLWFTSADSSGNGHRLNSLQVAPQYPRWHWGVGGSQIQKSGKLSKGCTGSHRIWYTPADSPGNGHRLNTIRPTLPQGHFGFF